MKTPNILKIKLTQQHLDRADVYTSTTGCILATALRDKYPSEVIIVGGDDVDLGGSKYLISDKLSVSDAYDPKNLPMTVRLTKKGVDAALKP